MKKLDISDPPDNIAEQVLNSCVIAGLNFFSCLLGMGATAVTAEPKVAIVAALISAGAGFFSSLAIQRGLKTRQEETET